MPIAEQLRESVGKNISAICRNNYTDPVTSHCAHFVSHILKLDFSCHCGELSRGRGDKANVRVQEIFPRCPKVGHWKDADLTRTQLIFVTRASNVDVAKKSMANHPQKHIGIFHDGLVYHYYNTADRVGTDTPESFLKKFQRIYDGKQGLFFGWIPGEDLVLNVISNGQTAKAGRRFDLTQGGEGKWFARELGEEQQFLVGKEVRDPARKFYGLYTPVDSYWGPTFDGSAYHAQLHQWAYLLEITGACESENHFALVNTYDRAKFTFGFYQLAAHTPRDNLILLMRRLAELPAFQEYFPDLKMRSGHLTRVDQDGSETDLEAEFPSGPRGQQQLQFFMNYLNPTRAIVEVQEVLQAARLIHWTVNDESARQAQIRVASEILQQKMARRYAPKLNLNGQSDTVCAIVADIFHQGRAKFDQVRPLLSQPDAERQLLHLNEDKYGGRNRRLRKAIAAAKDAGRLGKHTYVAASNEFVAD